MCGGIAVAAGQANRQNLNNNAAQRAIELGFWQLGRVTSYAVIGALVGAFGAFFLSAVPFAFLRTTAFVMANLMLIALGLYIAQLWSGMTKVERMGQLIWKFIAPLASATLVPQTPKRRNRFKQIANNFRAGAIWGWLPCGLVYSMLITASVTGSAANASLWMIAFGLGTIPALWLASMASHQAGNFFKQTAVRKTAGLLIAAFGLWGLLRVTGLITITWLDAFCIGGGSFQ
jgi:sulfite exporter TauE/SafE